VSGLFIAIEGIDGVGKSTQVERLAARFEQVGRTVLKVREPGGTTFGESVRDLLLRQEEIEIAPEAQMLLFLASRVELWRQEIAPALESGQVVISDRFHLSTIVYQGIAGALGEARVTAVCAEILGDRRPDLSLVLELPAAVARQRLGTELDRFERGPGFLELVASGFAVTKGIPGDRIERISAEGTPDEVEARLSKVVSDVVS